MNPDRHSVRCVVTDQLPVASFLRRARELERDQIRRTKEHSHGRFAMRVTVLGATGGVGRRLLEQSLAAGHDVTAVARRPEAVSVPAGGGRLQVVGVDFGSAGASTLTSALTGSDAVLSAVGPTGRSGTSIAARATATLVAAMVAADVHRLVVVSAAPVGGLTPAGQAAARDPGDDRLTRWVLGPIIRRVLAEVYADLAAMEDVLRGSDRTWTAIRPPRLTDGPSRPYRTALDRNLPGGRVISRGDLAHEMLAVLDRPETFGHTLGIAY
jgi:uncharacterized protein YbjT (DUF2867 family)